jgi:hypothetical protein
MITIAGGIVLGFFALIAIFWGLALAGVVVRLVFRGVCGIFRLVFDILRLLFGIPQFLFGILKRISLPRRTPLPKSESGWDANVPRPDPIYFPRVEAGKPRVEADARLAPPLPPMRGLKSLYYRRSDGSWHRRR